MGILFVNISARNVTNLVLLQISSFYGMSTSKIVDVYDWNTKAPSVKIKFQNITFLNYVHYCAPLRTHLFNNFTDIFKKAFYVFNRKILNTNEQ